MRIQGFFERRTKESPRIQAPWVNGERAEYTIHVTQKSDGKVRIGEMVFESRCSEEMGDEYISLITRTNLYNPIYTEEVIVSTHKESYRPFVTHIRLGMPRGETIQVRGTYKRNKVEILTKTSDTKHKTHMKVPSHVFDNYQAHLLMRSLVNTSMGYSTSMYVVHILRSLLTNPKLTVEAKEIVEVPAGTFVCWRISSKKELKDETQQYILLSERKPHPMVKNIKGSQIIELTRYVKP